MVMIKLNVDEQFVNVAEEMSDVRSVVVNTKSKTLKFVEDKFSLLVDESIDNSLTQAAGKQVDTRLGQMASDLQTMYR